MSEGSLGDRAREALRDYAIVAAYLYVCFGAILLYRTALLREEGLAFLPHGLAAITGFRAHARLEMLAKSLLMLFILAPMIAFEEYQRRAPVPAA